jgi:hypothetical protein
VRWNSYKQSRGGEIRTDEAEEHPKFNKCPIQIDKVEDKLCTTVEEISLPEAEGRIQIRGKFLEGNMVIVYSGPLMLVGKSVFFVVHLTYKMNLSKNVGVSNPSYLGGWVRRIASSRLAKILWPHLKKIKTDKIRLGYVAQWYSACLVCTRPCTVHTRMYCALSTAKIVFQFLSS